MVCQAFKEFNEGDGQYSLGNLVRDTPERQKVFFRRLALVVIFRLCLSDSNVVGCLFIDFPQLCVLLLECRYRGVVGELN